MASGKRPSARKTAPNLTGKQKRFISEYFRCNFNATIAAKNAGYSEKTARFIGAENLTKPNIRVEIDARFKEHAMSANEVIARIAAIGRSDADDYLDDDGYIDIKRLRERGKTQLVKRVKRTKKTFLGRDGKVSYTEETIELEMHDAQSALVTLARHHKLLTDRVELADWRTDLIAGIRAGEIDYPLLLEELDKSLADELFELAGVPVSRQS
jgi:phage terminase small subunit